MKFDVFSVGVDQHMIMLAMDKQSFDEIRTAAAHAAVSVGDLLAASIQQGLRSEFLAAWTEEAREAAARGGFELPVPTSRRQAALFEQAPDTNPRGRTRGEIRTIRRGNEPLWTIDDVAGRVGLGRSTIGRAIQFGELEVMRTSSGGKSIRVPEHAVVDFCRRYLPAYKGGHAKAVDQAQETV